MAVFATKEIPFGWRITLSLHCLCGVALAVGALFLPETPRKACKIFFHGHGVFNRLFCDKNRFLVKKHKDMKALKVLVKIHPDQGRAEGELSEIQTALRQSRSHDIWQTLKYLFSKSVLPRFDSHTYREREREIKFYHGDHCPYDTGY